MLAMVNMSKLNVMVQASIRGYDKWGSGAYKARRGNHFHNGVDIACIKGSGVLSFSDGKVTKIGFPYNFNDAKKGHFRYVEVTTNFGHRERYFYLSPIVSKGFYVKRGRILGVTQGLTDVYQKIRFRKHECITDHFHFEVIKGGEYIDPVKYLNEL